MMTGIDLGFEKDLLQVSKGVSAAQAKVFLDHLQGVRFDTLKDQVYSQIKRDGHIPSDVAVRVCIEIFLLMDLQKTFDKTIKRGNQAKGRVAEKRD